MNYRTLGKTGLKISRLGVGLAEIGHELTLSDVSTAGQVLNSALDGGINFLDTSACYGISEELIGRTVAHRRDEYVLATKCGHTWDGYPGQEWTPQIVRDSIERSLRLLKTDHLDLVQLHSCEVDVLERGEVVQALQDAKQAGKTRFVGFSGDNEAARWAIDSGLFDTLQTSFNLVDQSARTRLFPAAQAQGMGIIAKRPIGNGAWGATSSPSGYANSYFDRAQQMLAAGPVDAAPDNRFVLALGFVLAHDAVDTAIVGTRNPAHMQTNLQWMESRFPITPEAVTDLQRRFEQLGADWPQLR